MDLEALRLFLHLSRSLHFGRTSRECHVSPSALSRSIQRLEDEAGATLLVRDRRSVALTDEGRLLQGFAHDTLTRYEALEQRLTRSQDRLQGSVSIFASVTACQSFLPPLLAQFRRAHPEVQIRLETGYALDALAMLRSGSVDVAVAALPDAIPPTLAARVVVKIPLVFVAPAETASIGELLSREPVPWGELPMVLPSAGLARDYVDRWFRKKRVTPRIYGEVAGSEAILSLISLGCGVGIVPRLVADQSPLKSSLNVLDVEPRLQPFRVGVCTEKKKLKSPIVKTFWESIDQSVE
ncbi:MAG TPA: HTH-type transcriptional activator IlvY [Polyangiaceae bacterium]|nr:HTH-type transcriptional activator IlvY [Polyangiaceae bacterium]